MINIKAYQRYGIKTDELVDEFEFCCWEDLYQWLDSYVSLNKCPECKKKIERLSQIPIRKRTQEQHLKLIRYSEGIKAYLFSMWPFKKD